MKKLLTFVLFSLLTGVAIFTVSPVFSQVCMGGAPGCPSGGGGSSSIASGTTPITGGTDTRVCFNDAAVINCNDAGLTFTKGTGTLAPTIISLPATGAATATSLNFGTAGTGYYGTSNVHSWSSSGGLKMTLDTTNLTLVGTQFIPSATGNNQTIGITGNRWAQVWLDATLTTAGTTGAQTINKNLGQVNFAAAATTLVVTDSRATATSFIFTSPLTADTTCKSFAITRAAGSFTITANAACTAETAVAFLVMAN